MEEININNFLKIFAGEKNFQNKMQAYILQNYWEEIAGDILATHCQIEKVEGNILEIVCDHSIFTQEIVEQKEFLLQQIKRHSGFENIDTLKTKTGTPIVPERILEKKSERDEILRTLEKRYKKPEKELKVLEKSQTNPLNSIDEIPENLDSGLKLLYELLVEKSGKSS